MQSKLPLIALLLTAPLYAGCANSVQVLTPGAGCSSLIPAGWSEPVPSAAFPADDAGETEWRVFGVRQTGQLVTANGRTFDVVGIVTACEARDREAIRQTRPWYRRLVPG